MRAPGEAPGMMALEVAMDEMAEKLGMDPVEFRIVNDTQVDPEHPERRFSQRQLVQCLRLGAERFGWSRRNATPGQRREGRWLVGMGMAAGFRNNLLTKSGARVRLDGRGVVTVETDMTDIGTGSYTIIAQTAAEMMGVPLEKVAVRLGDSDFPVSAGLGRAVGRQQRHRRRLRRLREAARGGGAAARLQLGRGGVRRRPGPRRQPERAARPGGGRGRPGGGGRDRVRRPRQALPAIDLRRALRRGGRRCRDRRDAGAADAGGLRGGAHPQPEIGAQPGDRGDDHGRGRGADGGAGGGQAPRLLRQPRPRGLRGAGARRHPAPGGDLPRRGGPDLLADEGQGRGRARALRRRARRSRTRSTTPPACACATTRSRSTS